METVEGSPQKVELAVVVRAFSKFACPLNLVTDSTYVADIVETAENSFLKTVSNDQLYTLLKILIFILSQRQHSYFVMHIHSHTSLPGILVECNRQADTLAMTIHTTIPNISEQAQLSHAFFHQNAPALIHMFNITRDQARATVITFPDCQKYSLPSTGAGVNPRGLLSLQIWQSNVTHYPSFGRFKYIHVSIDTFSGTNFASAHISEVAKDVIKHFLQAFSTLGIPQEIKTNNGPAYISQRMQQFFNLWGIKHITGIPHSPTGQSIIERTHGSFKRLLEQQKREIEMLSTVEKLAKAT